MNWAQKLLEGLRDSRCKAQLAEQEKLWLETIEEEQLLQKSLLNNIMELRKQIPLPLPELEIVGTITSGEVKKLALAIIATDIEIPLGEGSYVDVSNVSMKALLKANKDFYRKPTKDDDFNCDRWADVMVGAIRSAHPGVAACACWYMTGDLHHACVLYVAEGSVYAVTQQTTAKPVFWKVWKPLSVTRLGGGF